MFYLHLVIISLQWPCTSTFFVVWLFVLALILMLIYIEFFSLADHFSECVESHAFETYDKFIKAQGGITKNFNS